MTSPALATDTGTDVLRLRDLDFQPIASLLAHHALALRLVDDEAPIPGSFWGEPEAGLVGNTVFVRGDTPLHSLLHEACHMMVMPPERRPHVHTDASDSQQEEDAACYLQIVLAQQLPGVGGSRLMLDMDTWGYTFRLGSARAWFTGDAQEARQFLIQRGLLPAQDEVQATFPSLAAGYVP